MTPVSFHKANLGFIVAAIVGTFNQTRGHSHHILTTPLQHSFSSFLKYIKYKIAALLTST